MPPLSVTLLSACQHVGGLATSVVVPLFIVRQAGLPPETGAAMIGLAFLAMAGAVVLQALPRGPVGSGYLSPSSFAGLYIGPSVSALQAGGLPLLSGMTFLSGLAQVCLAPLTRRLRPYLPPEVAGTVTFLLGIAGGVVGLRDLLGIGHAGPVPTAHWVVGGATLATIVVLNVWGGGLLRLSCVLIGMAVGYSIALWTGLLPVAAAFGSGAKLLALPRPTVPEFAFDSALVVPFLLTALIASVKSIAVTTLCQRTNDAGYVRPDLASITRGLLADGLITATAGAIGTSGINASSSSPGLAAATGVTSRRVAYAIAAIMVLLAFSPAAANLFAVIPDAVGGAILVFSSCFVITSGIEIMGSRLLDSRRMLVIASAILAAEGTHLGEALTGALPLALHPLAASPLLLGTAVALTLNALFRSRARRGGVLMVDPSALDPAEVQAFVDARGAAWGARPAVIARAGYALAELMDALVRNCRVEGPIRVDAGFDEFRVELRASYRGVPMPLPTSRPSLLEIADAEDGPLRLSGFLLRRQADRVRSTARDGACSVELQFDH